MIEYRVWSEYLGMEVIESFYWFEENGVVDFDGEGFYEDYKIMRFTGLFDRTSTAIYEGDILEWLGQRFPITIDSTHGHRFMFGEDQLCKANAVNGKIVGNIYDNPELTYGRISTAISRTERCNDQRKAIIG